MSTFTRLRNEIIEESFRFIGKLTGSQSLLPKDLANGIRSLNTVVQNLRAKGLSLWEQKEVIHAFTASSIVLASDGYYYSCTRTHTATTDDEPGVGKNWAAYWVKRGSTGSAWVEGTDYNAIGDFNLEDVFTEAIDIDYAVIKDEDGTVYPLTLKSEKAFDSSSITWQEGTPEDITYGKNRVQGTDATILVRLYPVPDDTDMVLVMKVVVALDDWDTNVVNPIPVKWIDCIQKQLAFALCNKYRRPIQERMYYKGLADEALRVMLSTGSSEYETTHIEGVYG